MREQIDPISDSYSLRMPEKEGDPYCVEFDDTVDNASDKSKSMAKRMHKLACLHNDLLNARIYAPRVADLHTIEAKGPTVYTSDLSLPTGMNTLDANVRIRHKKKDRPGGTSVVVHEIKVDKEIGKERRFFGEITKSETKSGAKSDFIKEMEKRLQEREAAGDSPINTIVYEPKMVGQIDDFPCGKRRRYTRD